MDAFEKVIAILLAVILMYIVPLNFNMQQMDTMSQSYVTKKTNEFVEAVRNNGYISISMYRDFAKELSNTNVLYDISLTHEHVSYEPVFDDVTGIYTNEIAVVNYDTYEEDIMEALGNEGYYYMSEGDYFSIVLYNRTPTMAGRLQQMLNRGTAPDKQILVTDGGRIRDENY